MRTTTVYLLLAAMFLVAACNCPECPEAPAQELPLHQPVDTLILLGNALPSSDFFDGFLAAYPEGTLPPEDTLSLVIYDNSCSCSQLATNEYRIPEEHPHDPSKPPVNSEFRVRMAHMSSTNCAGIGNCRFANTLFIATDSLSEDDKWRSVNSEGAMLVNAEIVSDRSAYTTAPDGYTGIMTQFSPNTPKIDTVLVEVTIAYEERILGVGRPIKPNEPIFKTMVLKIPACSPLGYRVNCTE